MRNRSAAVALIITCTMACSDAAPPPILVGGGGDASTDGAPKDAPPDAPADGFAPTCTPAPRKSTGSSFVAYQGNSRHDGRQAGDEITLPLCPRWWRDFGPNQRISYPVINGTLAYFTVGEPVSSVPATLFAVEAATGKVRWSTIVSANQWSALTFASNRVVVLAGDGKLMAFDAVTGSLAWLSLVPSQQKIFDSPPTAWEDRVYVGVGGSEKVAAFSVIDGSLLWSSPVQGGDHSSPAIDFGGVFVGYYGHAYGFNSTSGALLWHRDSALSGGTGHTPSINAGRVYLRDLSGNRVVWESDGTDVGTFTSTTIPAFYDTTRAFFVSGGQLRAADLPALTDAWTFVGDGKIVTAPLVIGSRVVVGSSSGKVYVVDVASGALVGSDDVGTSIDDPSAPVTALPSALGEGDGLLFVPAHGRLVVY